jgi:hypothetical protein
MSALPPKADIRARDQDVCFGPKGDICSATNLLRYVLTNLRQQFFETELPDADEQSSLDDEAAREAARG